MSGVWELPFGRGKPYLSRGIVSQVLGNWQLNSVVQLRSGQPYNLAVAGDVANIGNPSFANYARPNIVGDPNPAHRTLNEWFDPNAFAVPSFSYGDFGRNGLRSASVYDADFSLFKNFPVGERFLVSFRAEFFNAFNNPKLQSPEQHNYRSCRSRTGYLQRASTPADPIWPALGFLRRIDSGGYGCSEIGKGTSVDCRPFLA